MSKITVIYGDTKIEVPADTQMEELKKAMAENFPELTNPDVTRLDEKTIKFTPKAGTKGAGENMAEITVIYGDSTIKVPAGTELGALKKAMAENFPELTNPEVTQIDETTIKFAPKAGTKGLDVIYGDTKIQVPDNTPMVSLKAAMAENFPELTGATVTEQEDGSVKFTPKAGTKGQAA